MADITILKTAFPHSRIITEGDSVKIHTHLRKLFTYSVQGEELNRFADKICFGLRIQLNPSHSYITTDGKEIITFTDTTYQVELDEQKVIDTITGVARQYAAQFGAELMYDDVELYDIAQELLNRAKKIEKIYKVC